jgi:hypothetical protein
MTTVSTSTGRYPVTVILTAVIAVVANVVIYFIASALGAMPESVLVPPMNLPITIIPVIMATLMGTLGGAIVFALLTRFTKNPVRIFTVIAVLVVIAMGIPPFTLSGAPASMIVALNIMHIVAGVIVVTMLTRSVRN